MLTVLRQKSQITIPTSIISTLGLKEGDQLEIYEDNGAIRIVPVVVYPKSYVNQLNSEIKQLKKDLKSGKKVSFDNIDSLLESLEDDT